jgi:uncharacterized protein YheU (UPF0270 family)
MASPTNLMNERRDYMNELPLENKVAYLEEQLGQTLAIIYRNEIDHEHAVEQNNENLAAETDFNNKQLKKKVTFLNRKLDELRAAQNDQA